MKVIKTARKSINANTRNSSTGLSEMNAEGAGWEYEFFKIMSMS